MNDDGSTSALPARGAPGALGAMHLLGEHGVHGVPLRRVRLEATVDSRTVLLIDTDLRRPGILRESRHEITPGELIALVRTHGAELPGENHVNTTA